MMKRVLILAPRLDVMFKEGTVPTERGPISEIRQHWHNFARAVEWAHVSAGDIVNTIELPLWQFNPELIAPENLKPDIVYVPHREEHQFPLPAGIEARYYMQSVFPHIFYVDSKGYAAGSSWYPMKVPGVPNHREPNGIYDALSARAARNESKFDQPVPTKIPDELRGYILFACQIPHDYVISAHSEVSVDFALNDCLKTAASIGKWVIVKGHPVNPGSMKNLRAITAKYTHSASWCDSINIHSLIEASSMVVTVNSGTGMEALLHKKPVMVYGRAEYDCVAMNPEITRDWVAPWFDEPLVRNFFDLWYDRVIDTTNPASVSRLVKD